MVALPMKCRRYLLERCLAFAEMEDGGQKAIVLQGFELPAGRFDTVNADILILLPASYPDSAPDMFHTMPWVRLVASNQYPHAADQPVSFGGLSWQRWSRHNNAWRPGIDGIWTMIKRVEAAMKVAI